MSEMLNALKSWKVGTHFLLTWLCDKHVYTLQLRSFFMREIVIEDADHEKFDPPIGFCNCCVLPI